MLTTISSLIPFSIIILLGYLLTKSSYLDHKGAEAISKLTFNVAVPILLFVSIANAQIPSSIGWQYIFSFYVPVVLLFLTGVVIAKFFFNFDVKKQAVCAVCCTYSNTTIVGIPLCIEILGTQSLIPLFVLMYLQNIILFSLGLLTAERDAFNVKVLHRSLGNILLQVIKSPIMLSVILGMIVNLSQLPIPHSLEKSLELFAQTGVPLALFVLGTTLSRFHFSDDISSVLLAVLIKNILLPCCVFILAYSVFNLEPLWAATATLAAAMPIGISGYIFSEKYKAWEKGAASSVLISTIVSVFSMPILLSVFGIL